MNARALLAAVLFVCAITTAQAGRNCESQPPEAANVIRAMELADRTARQLDASGASVVVLARAGQDLSRYGLRWSHLALAYKDSDVWRVVHKLNQCGAATADVYRQGLGEFFLDDLFQYQAAFVVPNAQVQAALLPLVQDNQRLVLLHTAAYNMVAYPWATTYQQSNQWALETLALSQEPSATTRERAQAWLKFKAYEPTTLHIGALTRLGARMSTANVAFDDHPNDKRFSDHIETVTVDSVFTWMRRAGLASAMQVVR